MGLKRSMVIDLGILSLLLLVQNGDAYEFKIGGSGDWSASASYTQWAERSRFQIGDTLLFNYQADKDSVLEVNKEDYNNCNTASPIEKYSDGHSMIKLTKSGPHYFISGLVENCKNNEKVVIVVMADRSNKSSSTSPPSPAPAGEESPAPPPAGEESQSPPPAPATEETNPASAPSDENPPHSPNGASSIITSFICSIGAFAGSSLLFVF